MNKSEKNLVILQNELDETDVEIRLKSAIVQAEQRITNGKSYMEMLELKQKQFQIGKIGFCKFR